MNYVEVNYCRFFLIFFYKVLNFFEMFELNGIFYDIGVVVIVEMNIFLMVI